MRKFQSLCAFNITVIFNDICFYVIYCRYCQLKSQEWTRYSNCKRKKSSIENSSLNRGTAREQQFDIVSNDGLNVLFLMNMLSTALELTKSLIYLDISFSFPNACDMLLGLALDVICMCKDLCNLTVDDIISEGGTNKHITSHWSYTERSILLSCELSNALLSLSTRCITNVLTDKQFTVIIIMTTLNA